MVKLPYVCRSQEPGSRYVSSMHIFENRIGKVGREEKRQGAGVEEQRRVEYSPQDFSLH